MSSYMEINKGKDKLQAFDTRMGRMEKVRVELIKKPLRKERTEKQGNVCQNRRLYQSFRSNQTA